MRDEKLVADILSEVVAAVDVPVTLKIRTGWSPQQRNGLSIAKIAEDAGIQALAVHGRTRACKFSGQAEYETIAEIKQAIAIPVFANGDINSPEKARAVLNITAADGVMIGRAAQGRPWLCGQIARYLSTGELAGEPDTLEIADIVRQHLAALYSFYGDYTGIRIARKHVGWYLRHHHANTFRSKFNRLETVDAQLDAIDTYFKSLLQHNQVQAQPSINQNNKELAA